MILRCCNFEMFRVEGASCNDIKWDILRDNQILSLITKKQILKKTKSIHTVHILCFYVGIAYYVSYLNIACFIPSVLPLLKCLPILIYLCYLYSFHL